jgi:predicted nucleotidyltransferase
VDNKKVDIRKRRKIMEAIEEVAGLYSYDLVFLGSVEKDFRNIILNTGEVIYERGRKG